MCCGSLLDCGNEFEQGPGWRHFALGCPVSVYAFISHTQTTYCQRLIRSLLDNKIVWSFIYSFISFRLVQQFNLCHHRFRGQRSPANKTITCLIYAVFSARRWWIEFRSFKTQLFSDAFQHKYTQSGIAHTALVPNRRIGMSDDLAKGICRKHRRIIRCGGEPHRHYIPCHLLQKYKKWNAVKGISLTFLDSIHPLDQHAVPNGNSAAILITAL